jgi:hypothetical protein
MFSRIFVSITLASLGLLAITRSAFAATIEDRDDVMILTGVVALGLMAALTLFYAIKWYFGLDAGPPPPAADDHAEAAHH